MYSFLQRVLDIKWHDWIWIYREFSKGVFIFKISSGVNLLLNQMSSSFIICDDLLYVTGGKFRKKMFIWIFFCKDIQIFVPKNFEKWLSYIFRYVKCNTFYRQVNFLSYRNRKWKLGWISNCFIIMELSLLLCQNRLTIVLNVKLIWDRFKTLPTHFVTLWQTKNSHSTLECKCIVCAMRCTYVATLP